MNTVTDVRQNALQLALTFLAYCQPDRKMPPPEDVVKIATTFANFMSPENTEPEKEAQ